MNFFLMQVLSLSVFVLIQSVPVATPRIRSPTFCPQSSSGNVTLDVFGMVNKTAYAQLGVWHRLPCPSYQQGENVSGASWYKEPGRQHLLTYHSKEGTFLPEHERYGPSFDFGLAIKGIEEGDAGRYQCEVLFGQIDESLKTVEEINIKVIGDSFQPSISHKSSMAIHEREQRRTVITCPYNPQTPNTFVVYWSLENVATMHNEIIGAKFFNGTVAQNQFCTDYSIGSNGSLTVNTWNSIGENQVTFWCHVFKRDGTPSSCSIKVYLRQESLLYLQKESKEVHPCSSLNPGSVAQDVFGIVNKTAYAQLGVWHRLPCPSYQQGENVTGVSWYKKPRRQDLISIHPAERKFLSNDERYGRSSDFSLVIKGIEERDAGRYQCEVLFGPVGISLKIVEEINIKVIGDSFQPNISDNSSNVTLQRGQRQKVTCPCDPQTLNTSVVYWSLGKGVTTPTQIIGARFFDGTVVQMQFGADYSIGSNGSLTINSWSSIEEDQVTFWCHVFKRDGTLSSCSTEAHILQDQPLNLALNASSALYLREGFKQILPCTNWRPGVPVCGIQWYLLSNSLNSTVVKYNLSSDFLQIDAAYMYDLASNFSLVIKAVESTHAGRFTCVPDCARSKPVEYMYLDTNVIGDLFPACRNYTASSVEVTNGQQIVLPCECAQQTRNASVTALFWSMGEGVTTGTSVNCAPLENGSMICSDGYSVSSNWSLTVSRLNDSGRFWCHVFWTNDTLSNCYTDVKFIDTSAGPCTSAAIIVIIVVLGLVASGYFMWNRRRSRRARDGRSEIIGFED
ncbi:uncharacterized protein LOC110990566 [Acanthaster planci]|uniref:Uncharacterized protein LOC110990566 n=1 Tax=Acanthaster planci TaxID=133434 RepID=A0A8B8A5S4_ACAPL|nr:uncharacterized protein LOC110990566 [Acanthaster planci]